MRIEPRYGVLQNLFADRVFRIPHYQRFYSWQARQRQDLFDDIKKLAKENEDQHHFMATIVCHRTGETKDVGAAQYRVHDVVDGQQRITTLILLLKSIELALPESSEDRQDLAKTLVKRDGHLILLQTNNVNEFNFNRFIREGIAPSKNDIQTHSDRNLASAIQACKQFVQTWMSSSDILSLMRLILQRLGFVVFDTEDSRVVYTIFEVLNSRGLAVDWLDKTKSVLMGRMYELSETPLVAKAEIESLQGIWSYVYREIAKEDISGEEILRITATLYSNERADYYIASKHPFVDSGAVRRSIHEPEDAYPIVQDCVDLLGRVVSLFLTWQESFATRSGANQSAMSATGVRVVITQSPVLKAASSRTSA